MKWDEAKPIYDEWALKYVGGSSYHGHIHGASLTSRRNAVEYDKAEFPEESLDGLCIVVYGSVDNLPADIPKPEAPHKELPVVYNKNAGPFELQQRR